MKNIISTTKKSLKGYLTQSISSSDIRIGGEKVINKLSMPVTFTKGEQNPIKLKKQNEARLGRAIKKLK